MSSVYSKLRPAKVRSAIARRRFERALSRLPVTGYGGPEDIGTPYGGWTLPVDLIGQDWLCYCVGVGADISFDLELIHRFDARVRAFEPVQSFVDLALQTAAGEPRFGAQAFAIAPTDGPIRMQSTHHPGSASVSPAGLYDTHDYTEMAGRSIASLMAEHGDERHRPAQARHRGRRVRAAAPARPRGARDQGVLGPASPQRRARRGARS